MCDGCGRPVPRYLAQFHLSPRRAALAWDHHTESGGQCGAYSAVRTSWEAPVEASARFANWLSTNGSQRSIYVVDNPDAVAYYVSEVNDLLWLSANVIGPAGLEPTLTLSLAKPHLSTLVSAVPLGVHHSDTRAEYIFLRLGVGDWLVTSKGKDQVMCRVSDAEFQESLSAAGVSVRQMRRELHVR